MISAARSELQRLLLGRRHVAVAVSGGSDSTALLILARQLCDSVDNPPLLTAVTVDHGLRPESAAEAQFAAALAARLGVSHRTIQWTGAKPKTGLQATARAARRQLIAGTAGTLQADLVLTGHTLDDQRETVFMRARRGTGPGLAGIAPASAVFNDLGTGEPLWFCRPLLGASRAALRDHVAKSGLSWIEDPSNAKMEFERVAIRADLANAPADALGRLDQLQQETAAQRRATHSAAAGLVAAFAREVQPGLLYLAPEFFGVAGQDGSMAALACLIAFAGGQPQMTAQQHVKTVFDMADRHGFAAATAPLRASLGGALVDLRSNGMFLMQERRRTANPALPFAGRYRQQGAGHAPLHDLPAFPDGVAAPASLVRHALMREPVAALAEGESLPAAAAWRQGAAIRRLLNPWPDLIPSFDFELAGSLARIGGFPPVPQLVPGDKP